MSGGDAQATWPLEAAAGGPRARRPAAAGRARGRRWRRLGAALLVATLTGAALFAFGLVRYRGMTLGMIDHARHATFGESRNLAFCIRYWLAFMERLERDPATGRWGFPPPAGEPGGRAAALAGADLDDCTLAYHRGDFGAAVACLDAEIAARGEREENLFWLGMSLLRRAENRNCLEHVEHGGVASDAGAYCTLPLERHHRDGADARRALATFLRLLERYDGEDRLYRWLASFAAMTVDAYPQAVPPRHRLPAAFVDRFYGAGRAAARARHPGFEFVDRAAELGVATLDAGRGVAIEDFDGDGDLDLVTGGSFQTLRYYANRGGDAGFEDRSAEAGVLGVDQPFAITAADYDGDGRFDIFAARPFDRYVLLRNEGPGATGDPRFRDVTEESGLLAVKPPEAVAATWISAWGDIDNDGDLDLFLAQWAFRMPGLRGVMGRPRMDSTLLLNEGGRFVDGGARWGVRGLLRDLYFIGAAFGDVDGDGDADLFLSSPLRRTSMLLRNDGDRLRRDRRMRRGESGFVAGFVDVDHDGRLDIFQSGFADARTSTEMAVFGEHLDRYRAGHSTVMVQTAAGGFEARDDFFAGGMPMGTMGASWGDLDNDGCFDFYLGTGNPESWFVLPNQMLLGRRDGRRCTGALDNVSMLGGFGTVQKGHGIVFFDFDDDGDQDVYSALGGMWPGDAWPNQMFVNESASMGAWVKLRLRGRRTNRHGVGARILVRAETAGGVAIERRYHMDNKTGFGSAPYLAHIGLLDAARIREVEVFWPASGCTASYGAELGALSVLDEAVCFAGPVRS